MAKRKPKTKGRAVPMMEDLGAMYSELRRKKRKVRRAKKAARAR